MKRNLLQCMARVLLLPVALMFICGALVSAHAEYSGPKVRFRLAHPCPPGHHTSLAFEKFAELVAQKSKNKIKVHVFPNAVLGSDVVMLKGALTGGLEMAVSSSPNLTWVVPSLMVFDLPYITSVKYQKNLYEALDNGELGRYFKGKFNEVGLSRSCTANTVTGISSALKSRSVPSGIWRAFRSARRLPPSRSKWRKPLA